MQRPHAGPWATVWPRLQPARRRNPRSLCERGPVGVAGGCQEGFELKVAHPERRRLTRDVWTADIVGWRVLEDGVDDTCAVEPVDDRASAGEAG